MATDDVDEFSTVSSSIFYAIRNPPEKQKFLLNILSSQRTKITEKKVEISSSKHLSDIEENNKKMAPIEKKEVTLKIQPLFIFYPDIPSLKEDKPTPTKPKKDEIDNITSPTRQLLSIALQETKKKLTSQKTIPLKRKAISKKEMKRRNREKVLEQTIRLNEFIHERKIKLKRIKELDEPQEMDNTQPNRESNVNDSPFPFTNLSEWLIWHHNFPELAFVREAYDPEQIPDKGDIKVFWVNVMNDPEFFNTEWRIAGSSVDIDLIKQQKHPNWAPEWDILSSYTDGFSIYFEDVYEILSRNPTGLENYRYPVLQFALKGLLLLDLAHYDYQSQKWFKKGIREDLSRLRILDQFVNKQTNLSNYIQKLSSEELRNEWYIGLICFDLIVIRSTFLKRFSQKHLTEEEKIDVLVKKEMSQIINEKLSTIENIEPIRVKNLKKKLRVE
ncbi:MAG: hypothetical protein ACFFAE_16440 [Candidatus Hodarchaeota archaeon]